ncbi:MULTISPECIES: DUF5313 family protein [Gordonia]|nr:MULTISPECIES: DUF5313 family protein [Gordonia]MBD0022735.1 DUF5313 family protein [Gordonia sp. (in: high G+C Gram-positive bacteria)]
MSRTEPSLIQRVKYLLGRPLPDEMREWVRNDVTGPGAARRYFMRGIVPLIPILIAFAFVPGPVIIRLCMMLLLLLPLLYFQFALIKVYRRHLLSTNGLDPELINATRDRRRDSTRSEYESIYRRD